MHFNGSLSLVIVIRIVNLLMVDTIDRSYCLKEKKVPNISIQKRKRLLEGKITCVVLHQS